MKRHVYIGKTSRSTYTRGKEHKNDARLMNAGSHVLKHYLKHHDGENPDDMKMGMKINSFRRSTNSRNSDHTAGPEETPPNELNIRI